VLSQVLRAIDTQVKARLDDNLAPCQSFLRVIKAKDKQSISDAAKYDDRPEDFRIGITPVQDSLQHSSEYLKPA
jgi:formyltetrahydrofolate synthetase